MPKKSALERAEKENTRLTNENEGLKQQLASAKRLAEQQDARIVELEKQLSEAKEKSGLPEMQEKLEQVTAQRDQTWKENLQQGKTLRDKDKKLIKVEKKVIDLQKQLDAKTQANAQLNALSVTQTKQYIEKSWKYPPSCTVDCWSRWDKLRETIKKIVEIPTEHQEFIREFSNMASADDYLDLFEEIYERKKYARNSERYCMFMFVNLSKLDATDTRAIMKENKKAPNTEEEIKQSIHNILTRPCPESLHKYEYEFIKYDEYNVIRRKDKDMEFGTHCDVIIKTREKSMTLPTESKKLKSPETYGHAMTSSDLCDECGLTTNAE